MIFRKSAQKIQLSLKFDKNDGYFTWRPTHIFFITPRLILFRLRNVLDKSCRENHSTFYIQQVPPPPPPPTPKSCRLWGNVTKTWYSQTGHR
jgi:hypothetical protein